MTQLRRQGGSQPGGRSTGLGVRGTAWVLVLTPLTTSLLRNIHLGSTGSFISTLPFSEAVSLSHTNLQGSRFLTQGNIGELGRGKISTGKQRKQTLGPFHILPSLASQNHKGRFDGTVLSPFLSLPFCKTVFPSGLLIQKARNQSRKRRESCHTFFSQRPHSHVCLPSISPMFLLVSIPRPFP